MINDTADFFDLDDFAEYVTVNGKKMKAIFDKVNVQHQEGFALVTDNVPHLTCQTVDLEKAKALQGTPVVVRKVAYEIADMQDDGTGISKVFLYKKV